MSVRFAKSCIDRLFAERDILGMHPLISVMERERQLPEEFWLFCRVIEWMSSSAQAFGITTKVPADVAQLWEVSPNAAER